LTLTRSCRYLEEGLPPEEDSGAVRLVNLLLESDVIDFVVGTRINEAHQDPSLPTELEMRRSIVRSIARLLEEKHLKRTTIRFI
ncbi:MAG: serine/threonine protein phosphatase, partial [Synergistales bacterium]|nr:serine/threonine protein phosphatase [Synergistales bacterium]